MTHYTVCPLCEATCGLAIEHEGSTITSIRGDDADPFSKGHICPKAVALKDIHEHPDRLRTPVRRTDTGWEPMGWHEAIEEAGRLLGDVRKQHGKNALAFYYGNPTVHSYGAIAGLHNFIKALGTQNVFSANAVDALPRTLVSYLLFGNQAAVPIPDLDCTRFLLILGANPLVSNGSVMTAPDMKARLRAIRSRGRVVVIDPRRTETAEAADAHHFIVPGADPLLLLAMLRVIFEKGLDAAPAYVDGLPELKALAAPFDPAAVAAATGIEAATITSLATDFATADAAVCYGRLGTSAHEFGALTTWLVDALNIVTGNFDRPGGWMFTSPAVDLVKLARLLGQRGSFGTYRSRVSGLPEFNHELPVAAFAEEMETPGDGQVRALITHAGNPVMSLPNGKRLDAAFAKLDAMVCLDLYVNETTRHADIIIPPMSPLERDHFPLVFHALSVRNVAHFAPALFPTPSGALEDWQVFLALQRAIRKRSGGFDALAGAVVSGLGGLLPPRRLVDLMLRFGRHKLSVETLISDHPHGVDLGPLEPRMPALLATKNRRLDLVPVEITADVARAEALMAATRGADLLLVNRRTLRSNNSWMHNCDRLTKGRPRCTLLMHPEDATRRRLSDGDTVRIESRIGAIVAPLVVSDEVMPGIVSLPHGWSHASVNDITDDARYDRVSGVSSLTGMPVEVSLSAATPAP